MSQRGLLGRGQLGDRRPLVRRPVSSSSDSTSSLLTSGTVAVSSGLVARPADEIAARMLKPYAAFMGKVRAALNKPRLPFLVVVTKTDKIDAKKAEGARTQVELRISTALAGDVPDAHFVHNFTRTELQEVCVNRWDVDRR
jgi:hypothetical protein